MPQLASAAIHHGLAAWFFRWAYQAKVMNTLDITKRTIVRTGIDQPFISLWCKVMIARQ